MNKISENLKKVLRNTGEVQRKQATLNIADYSNIGREHALEMLKVFRNDDEDSSQSIRE